MSDERAFRQAITALWERLGLGPPRFDEPGRVRLVVETTKLDLIDDGRGHLVVEGVAVTLSVDAMRRIRQIRRVLEVNIGLLLDNDIGVYEAELPSGAPVAKVRASYAYSSNRPDRLLAMVEDCVWALEFYAKEINADGGPGGRRSPSISRDDDNVIFTP